MAAQTTAHDGADGGRAAGGTGSARIKTGETIDGFRVGEKLHLGGMATLWRVTRPDIAAPLVMKTPLILDGDDATAIVGFEMEQMILPLLNGPHAPHCFSVGDFAAPQPYVVMEDVQGDSLLPLLDSLPRPVEEVCALGAKTADAIADLHRQNVIHHDIKPSNVMIRRATGEAVLIDYGLSRHEMLPDLLSEEFDLPMGTGPYISPEQVRGDRADPRSDLYALGVLLYHLATGVRPFGFPRTRRALRKRLWRQPAPLRRLNPDIPPWFQEIVLRCLEVDPTKRYPTAEHVAFDLRNVDQVRLTHRGLRTRDGGALDNVRRWWRLTTTQAPATTTAAQSAAAPILMAAIDLSDGMEVLNETLRAMVERQLRTLPGARLACVNVLRQNRIALNYPLDEQGRNIHLHRLAELKHWARPLDGMAAQITFHVLEATDPAAALVEYARANKVDQIVTGARAASTLRRYLGTVASYLVARAPCAVTVVRPPQMAADYAPDAADPPT